MPIDHLVRFLQVKAAVSAEIENEIDDTTDSTHPISIKGNITVFMMPTTVVLNIVIKEILRQRSY